MVSMLTASIVIFAVVTILTAYGTRKLIQMRHGGGAGGGGGGSSRRKRSKGARQRDR